jgi:hypothetical protein
MLQFGLIFEPAAYVVMESVDNFEPPVFITALQGTPEIVFRV